MTKSCCGTFCLWKSGSSRKACNIKIFRFKLKIRSSYLIEPAIMVQFPFLFNFLLVEFMYVSPQNEFFLNMMAILPMLFIYLFISDFLLSWFRGVLYSMAVRKLRNINKSRPVYFAFCEGQSENAYINF